ncbi:DUF3515 domain-containing protein [Quadrisphaera sp. DSM 44207]|uniref:DUF3515 domain-containing protein n=1 Tax=Quadrisphaera sp. DSM 44207 TaxID=1881057 RepID=UPI00088B0965|nr:DUF3515 domain-containing protein [Quadrisphaera sp. DSM 44207]SDQ75404.1 Protein of unknown function [Quadrisphaera sp. DSM 44207]
MRRPAALAGAAAAALASAALGGCAAAVTARAAPDATDPICSQVLVALPEEVGDEARRETTAQATAAWGDPPVVLRCGVTSPGPTTWECVFVEGPEGAGVDWVVVPPEETGGDRVVWVSFGRAPAVELSAPAEAAGELAAVASAVSGAVSVLPSERSCT